MRFLQNLNISKKIFTIIFISILSLLTVSVLSIQTLNEVTRASETMYSEQEANRLFGELRNYHLQLDAYSLDLLLAKEQKEKQEIMDKSIVVIEKIEKTVKKLEGKNLSYNIKKEFQAYKANGAELAEISGEIINLSFENQSNEAYLVYKEEVEPNRIQFNEQLVTIQRVFAENAEQIYKKSQSDARRTTTLSLIIMTVSLIISALIGLLITRMIAKPVKDIQELFSRVEQGDLTIEGIYQSKDEIGRLTSSFNTMITGLKSIVQKVNDTSQYVAASSEQLSTSAGQNMQASENISLTIQELAEGADQQAGSISDSTAVIQEMAETTNQIKQSVDTVSVTSQKTSHMSVEGTKAIEKVNNQMQTIHTSVGFLAETFKGLTERSNEIGNITEVITNIAGQTNLLALNAAIEAARAGEQGKGFAVVADEVRKLAEQSASSAEQITKLISLIQMETEQTMRTVVSTTEEVREGLAVVEEAGRSFNMIDGAIQTIVRQTEAVTHLVQKLMRGTNSVQEEINKVKVVAEEAAVNSLTIRSSTQEQLASMEEITSSSQALTRTAEELKYLIQHFKIKT